MTARIIAAAALLTFGFATQSAIAQTDYPIRQQVEVRFDDLDLSTQQGQKELHRRVEKAARKVCRISHPVGSLTHAVDNKCYAAAIKSAEPQMACLTNPTATNR